MHVALARLRTERVDLLLHAEHVEGGDAHDLGLATLEDRGAVHAGDDLDLGRERADVGEPATVDADTVGEDALADELLGHGADGCGQLLLTSLELAGESGERLGLDLVEAVLAVLLVRDGERLAERRGDLRIDRGVGVVLVVEEERELTDRLRSAGGERGLGLAELADEDLRGLEALGHDLFGRGSDALVLDEVPGVVGGLGLDHHDRDVVPGDTTGDDHVEDGLLLVGVLREGDPLAVDQSDADSTDRAGERQAGELGGQRRDVDREGVVGVVRVGGEDGHDDLDLVAQALDEGRAERAVDETAREDGLGAGASLATEERAGDAARGVHALFDVDRQREEVELVLGVLADRRGRQQHRLAVEVRDCRPGSLAGQAARLETDGAGAEAPVVDDCFFELDLGTLHGCPPVLRVSAAHTARRSSIEAYGRLARVRGSGSHYRGPDDAVGSGRWVMSVQRFLSDTELARPQRMGPG